MKNNIWRNFHSNLHSYTQYLHYWICNNEQFQTFWTVQNQYPLTLNTLLASGWYIFCFGNKLGTFKWESFDLIKICKIRHCWIVINSCHDDVIKWKHFPRYWPFGRRIHRSPVNSPRSFCVFFDPRPNKRLSKQLWGRWFETHSPPLWRHSNALNNPGYWQKHIT